MKKALTLLLVLSLTMCLIAGCGNKEAEANKSENTATSQDGEEQVTIKVGGLSGPTSMGLVKLMEDSANGDTQNSYEFADLATDPASFVAPLAQGEIDIAAVPSNLASVIYNNTQGKVKVIAVNTLCVLNIVERGEAINSIGDLKGKTMYATGQGATPEYTLRYLLAQNNIDADKDVTIQWCADTTEALSYVTKDEEAIAMLPQPFATVAMTKVEGLRVALDLNEEWDKANDSCRQVTGVLVARTDFIESYPQQVEMFLEEYEKSIGFLSEDVETSAQLIEKYGIVPAPVAKKALPCCHIVCLTKGEMKDALSGFLDVLYEQNPQSIGGKVPDDEFYY